jgi:DNA-binding NarL/FixJ family response regulator
VTEANSLKAGTQALLHQPIDVVLCDVRLPDGNGVEFIKTVKIDKNLLHMLVHFQIHKGPRGWVSANA